MANGIKGALFESNFGEFRYNVEFNEIICKESCFPKVYGLSHDLTANIRDVRLHGVAIAVAENIKEQKWILTKEGFLVCGGNAEDVKTLILNILIDENINTLNSSDYVNGAKAGQSRKVEIHGLDVKVGDVPGMWCVFQ